MSDGLGYMPISGRSSYAVMSLYPGRSSVQRLGVRGPIASSCVCRGEIAGFSVDSRRRLLMMLGEVDWRSSGSVYFVSLTYHRLFGDSWHAWKRDLALFRRRLFRQFAACSAVWRFAFQRRGAPHFHLVIFCGREVDLQAFRRWCVGAWSQILHETHNRHFLRHGCDVRAVDCSNVRRLMFYLGAYVAKVDRYPTREVVDVATGEIVTRPVLTGRCWGVWGKLPRVRGVMIELDEAGYREVLRRIVEEFGDESAYLAGAEDRFDSGTVIVEDWAVVWDRLLKGIRYREVDMGEMDGTGGFAGDLRHAGDRK